VGDADLRKLAHIFRGPDGSAERQLLGNELVVHHGRHYLANSVLAADWDQENRSEPKL